MQERKKGRKTQARKEMEKYKNHKLDPTLLGAWPRECNHDVMRHKKKQNSLQLQAILKTTSQLACDYYVKSHRLKIKPNRITRKECVE